MIASLEEATGNAAFQFTVTPSGLLLLLVPLADARGYRLSSLRDLGIVV